MHVFCSSQQRHKKCVLSYDLCGGLYVICNVYNMYIYIYIILGHRYIYIYISTIYIYSMYVNKTSRIQLQVQR